MPLTEKSPTVFLTGPDEPLLAACRERFASAGYTTHVFESSHGPASFDPMNAEDWSAAFGRCLAETGGLDVIVAIAGHAPTARIDDLSKDAFVSRHRAIAKPAVLAQNQGLLAMRGRGRGGAFVHVLPDAARVAREGEVATSVATAGILYSSKAAALECAREKDGIVVNAVLVGDVPASDIAESVFFYATDGAAYMTGTDLPVDDGYLVE